MQMLTLERLKVGSRHLHNYGASPSGTAPGAGVIAVQWRLGGVEIFSPRASSPTLALVLQRWGREARHNRWVNQMILTRLKRGSHRLHDDCCSLCGLIQA
jgi:hypothetical protein